MICYDKKVEIRLSEQNVYSTENHILWIIKYHRRILNPGDECESIEEIFFLSTENKLEEECGMIIWISIIDSCDK